MKMTELKNRVDLEEIFNAISHGLGFALSIAGMVILLVFAYMQHNGLYIFSFSIYGASAAILYLASTLYHSFPKGKIKDLFRIFDHSAIYVLIAGTYTPIALISLKGALGWTVFGIIWAIAIAGIVFKVAFINKFKKLSLILYIGMGWLVVLIAKPIIMSLSTKSIIFLAIGGALYMIGTIFYAWKELRFSHTIWHFFVLAGSICHFFTMLYLL